MRAFNRLLCLLLAAAIAVAGVLAVIEIIAANTDHDPVFVKWHGLVDDMASNEWKTAGPRVAAIVLIIVGLLLLFFALRRGQPNTVALTTNAHTTDMTTTRRSLQRSLSTVATSVDGVAEAKAKVRRRKIVVTGRAGTADHDGAQSRLESQMQDRIDGLSLADARKLKVRLAPAPEKRTPETAEGVDDADSSATSATGSATGSNTGAEGERDRTPVGVGTGNVRTVSGQGGGRDTGGRDDGGSDTRGSDTRGSDDGGLDTTASNPVPGFDSDSGPSGSGSSGSGTNPGGTP